MPLGPTCHRQKGFIFWRETSAVIPLTCGPFASQGPTCLPLESLCRVPIALFLEAQPSRPQLPFCHLPSSRPINLVGFLPHWGFLPPSSPPTFHPSHRHPPPPHPAALRGWSRRGSAAPHPPLKVRWLRRGSAAPHPPLDVWWLRQGSAAPHPPLKVRWLRRGSATPHPPLEVQWLRRGSAAPHPPLEGAAAMPWRHRSSSTWTTPSIS